ncbi:site-specific DNA-methyltransferase [Dyadobacter fermentans]|uniref:site-specific DNA-methyltransferase (adenine-specific) n=1 Tax=Dyadobacter fermentans (strain ATCC 700827 / DSM 18053 / CIP 107007 / KCTC 52180 / NS114) TaxID=471854 RepID=C6VT61_DYAFD|nr:site-specific DNA-methyltransferase [Dyadobacter fermentans]ACT96425.1 Site-specific DNA-methyltransferase (adenine- specific) [Dyadobacter fermentans DSM 18053]
MPYLSEEDRLDMASPDLVSKNLEALAALFPNCITETENGKAVDFDLLKQELSHQVIEGNKERYRLEWPGKREAIVTANLPTTKTLRPSREHSVNFDETENLFIEGDNLDVLKLLQESYFGKIKMIYIDPPYNTGKDFVYKDNFSRDTQAELFEGGQKDEYNHRLIVNPETSGRYHSDWLSMMYPRLKLARNLLGDNGVIFISIDENEVKNLLSLCDEIFGEQNALGNFIWKKKAGGGDDSSQIALEHEYVAFYAKAKESVQLGQIEHESPSMTAKYNKVENGRRYYLERLDKTSLTYSKSMDFPIVAPDGTEIYPPQPDLRNRTTIWRWSKDKIETEKSEIEFHRDKKTGEWRVYTRTWESLDGVTPRSLLVENIHGRNRDGGQELAKLIGPKIFSNPKPLRLLKHLIRVANLGPDDIVLDFFAGSASMAHAILDSNSSENSHRKFIMVQLPEPTPNESGAYINGYTDICQIGRERIRQVGKALGEQYDQKRTAELDFRDRSEKRPDIGFRAFRLDSSNMQDVYYRPQDYQQDQMDIFTDNIKPDRTADDLLAQVMLDWGLPLSYKIEQLFVLDKKVFRVAQDSLLACFDKGIDEAFAKEIASYKPLRIVFRDQSFKDDTAKENVRQLLKQLSPDTEMRVI